jgi:hypothetical protein
MPENHDDFYVNRPRPGDGHAYGRRVIRTAMQESRIRPETSRTIDNIVSSFDGIGWSVKATPGTILSVPRFPPVDVRPGSGYSQGGIPEGSPIDRWANRGVEWMHNVLDLRELRESGIIGPDDNQFFTIKYLRSGQALIDCMVNDTSGEGDADGRRRGLQHRLFSMTQGAAYAFHRIVVTEGNALAYQEFLDRATPGFEKPPGAPRSTAPGIHPDHSGSVTYIRYDAIQPALEIAESAGLPEAAYYNGRLIERLRAPGAVVSVPYPVAA